AYGEADARRALAETRRRGTGCLCRSVGAATDIAALRRVFGTAAHAAIPRATQLAGVVGPLFRSAVASADVQRRLSQRRERTRERLQVERRTAWRKGRGPTTCLSATKSGCSRPRTARACRSCSRGRPAAAR